MSDLGDMMELGLKIAGVFALAAAAVVGTGIYVGVEHHNESKAVASMTSRAQDTLRNQSLTVITMDKFSKKAGGCDADHPYGADFVAQNKDGKVVKGHICSAPDRENVVTLKP
jgi:hypothetical protein